MSNTNMSNTNMSNTNEPQPTSDAFADASYGARAVGYGERPAVQRF